MATIISNPTTSFRSSIQFARTKSSIYNLQTNSFLIGSSCSGTSKKIWFRSPNQRKIGFRSGVSFRRFVISCGVTEIDQTQFSETVLCSDLPVLVEFVANWCGPCRLISPAIEWASQFSSLLEEWTSNAFLTRKRFLWAMLPSAIAWAVWNERNNKMFNSKIRSSLMQVSWRS